MLSKSKTALFYTRQVEMCQVECEKFMQRMETTSKLMRNDIFFGKFAYDDVTLCRIYEFLFVSLPWKIV